MTEFVEVLFLLIAAAVGATTYIYSNDIVSKIADATMMGFITYATIQLMRGIYDSRKVKATVAKAIEIAEEGRRELSIARNVEASLDQVTSKLLQAHDIRNDLVRSCLVESINGFAKALTMETTGFQLEGEHLSLRLADVFWRKLFELQVNNRGKPLITRITHATAVDVWLTQDSTLILDHQRRFSLAGGRVVRILIDISPSIETLPTYIEVFNTMRGCGIDVFYLPVPGRNVPSDFLIVDDLKYALIWETRNPNRRLDYCRLHASEQDYNECLALWRPVWMQLLECDYDSLGYAIPDKMKEKPDEALRKLVETDELI
jgi:hypothetical protein